jgi:hypothetical protein
MQTVILSDFEQNLNLLIIINKPPQYIIFGTIVQQFFSCFMPTDRQAGAVL